MKHCIVGFFLLLLATCPAHAATYVAAHDAAWPPFEFMNTNNAVVGFTIDYLDAVGREAQFAVTNTHIPWDSIFSALARGDCRIVASSVTITQDRAKKFDFSIPYFETYQHLLLPFDSTATHADDLPGAVLGAQAGTVGQQTIISRKDWNSKLFDDLVDAVEELANGEIDGVVCDFPVGQYYATSDAFRGKVKSAPFRLTDKNEQYGFVVQKGDTEMLEALNRGIRAVQKKQIERDIYTKWFGESRRIH